MYFHIYYHCLGNVSHRENEILDSTKPFNTFYDVFKIMPCSRLFKILQVNSAETLLLHYFFVMYIVQDGYKENRNNVHW